jgi:hypothetical protein
MKKDNIKKYLYACLALSIMLLSSCQKELLKLTEPPKDITGSWQIVQLVRNKEDITSRLDLSKFKIIFNADHTFTLQDQFSFVVSDPGTYSLDDPNYPFLLKLQTPKDTVGLNFDYPIVNGKREIRISISQGCQQNSYEYSFAKEQ